MAVCQYIIIKYFYNQTIFLKFNAEINNIYFYIKVNLTKYLDLNYICLLEFLIYFVYDYYNTNINTILS